MFYLKPQWLLILAFTLSLSACRAEQTQGTQGWEYKFIETDREDGKLIGFIEYLESEFNALGKDGWEMVGYAMNNGSNVRYVCFKRPL